MAQKPADSAAAMSARHQCDPLLEMCTVLSSSRCAILQAKDGYMYMRTIVTDEIAKCDREIGIRKESLCVYTRRRRLMLACSVECDAAYFQRQVALAQQVGYKTLRFVLDKGVPLGILAEWHTGGEMLRACARDLNRKLLF